MILCFNMSFDVIFLFRTSFPLLHTLCFCHVSNLLAQLFGLYAMPRGSLMALCIQKPTNDAGIEAVVVCEN